MSPDDLNSVITAVITGLITAVGSSLLTIAGIRVHIEYLRKADERHENNITEAHKRIDVLAKEIHMTGRRHHDEAS